MISVCQAEISDLEKQYVLKAVEEGMLSGRAPTVKQFEEKFAEYIGTRFACMVPNGTIALHLSLRVAGVGPGDEVILPSSTISSCIYSVHYLGATAVIVDVNKDTWCMDAPDIMQAITSKTKAIMPVHLYGMMSNVPSMKLDIKNNFARDICIVEDAAEAIGSEYNGHKAGSFGDFGCFSLFFNKNITTGEGGMITTNSAEFIEKLRYFRDLGFGKTPETKFLANDLAYNYRPSGIISSLGLAQLERVDYLVGRRLEIHEWYKKYLSPKFIWQKVTEGYKNSYWMEAVLLPQVPQSCNGWTGNRDKFMQYMRENGIETRPSFPPLGSHPYLQQKTDDIEANQGDGYPYKWRKSKYSWRVVGEETNSQYIWENAVLLPSGGKEITEEVVEYVCGKANKFLEI